MVDNLAVDQSLGFESTANLDNSARAGLFLAAVLAGRSYQPNLLSRGTTDQAVITGVSAVSGYGAGVAGHSLLSAVGRRIYQQPSWRQQLVVDLTATAIGLGVAGLCRWQERESRRRALARLAGTTIASAGAAGSASLVSRNATETNVGAWDAAVGAAAIGVGSWLATQPWRQSAGSVLANGQAFEDATRSVSPIAAIGTGVGVSVATYGLAQGEAHLSKLVAHTGALVFGGEPADHRMLGRVGAAAASYWGAKKAFGAVSAKLTSGGEEIEPAHALPPVTPEVTGGPGSNQTWSQLSREGRRWLSMALTPAGINAVMQREDAMQPIRVYAAQSSAYTPVGRAQLLLDEIDRTGALDRAVFVLFSPTGSGYVNYVANETLEYLTGGNCASAAIQYSVLPSSFSLGEVGTGTLQTRLVLEGVAARLRQRTPEQRPRVLLFGESLGSQVSEDMFTGMQMAGPIGLGIDAAIWIGTPAATKWNHEIDVAYTAPHIPGVGPAHQCTPKSIADWEALPQQVRQSVKYLLLQNGNDPIPKFEQNLLWQRPAWLGKRGERKVGDPQGSGWTPVTTFFATFFDMLNALTPVPGTFAEGGHDYREVLPSAIMDVWGLTASAQQEQRMQWALRLRELAWELNRRWSVAQSTKPGKTTEQKVLADLTSWLGRPVSAGDVAHLLKIGLQPAPGANLEEF